MNYTTKLIYEPKGKAKEYADLALNVYNGCSHGCKYCYAPMFLHKTTEQFQNPTPKNMAGLEKDCKILQDAGCKEQIHLCFTCDPYQPIEQELKHTRRTLETVKSYGLSVLILTKGGTIAQRDFDLLDNTDAFGVTLTCDNAKDTNEWEPGAASYIERISNLKAARYAGIKTWVSFEPVLFPEQTLWLIEQVSEFADMVKLGKLNHNKHAQNIDWNKYANDAVALVQQLGLQHYIKVDLAACL